MCVEPIGSSIALLKKFFFWNIYFYECMDKKWAIFSMFHWRNKVKQVWNYMRVSKWWQKVNKKHFQLQPSGNDTSILCCFTATLRRIDLTGNLISEIEDGAFSKLDQLEELTLAENKLVKLPMLPAKLMSLNVNHNLLKTKGIKANIFKVNMNKRKNLK